jgi:tRNA threonylcarbamoyladenosine biosynthesis protein TsaE
VALEGEIGAGKTTITKGLATGLGIADYRYVSSPSYILMTEYPGRVPVYHFDAYFMEKGDELLDAGAEEFFFSDGVCIVEWADRVAEAIPEEAIRIVLRPVEEGERRIEIEGPPAVCQRLKRALGIEEN